MPVSRSVGGVRRIPAVAGAVVAVTLLGAGVASAAGPVQLKSRLAGNWCFDAPNGNNTATMVNPCTGAKSQLWDFTPGGQIESVAFPGQCVNIAGAADDTPVVLSACRANADNQRWNHRPDGQVTSALGPCLNIYGGVANPGTPVIAYHCIPGVEDEQWDSVS
ncbi:MAG: RICIN domain-containing protein [Mycobacterium sp.]|uniref:Rv1419 family lectin n=1 Tax=Mycobacterium sp. TaxID=1785 RepID=UPI00260C5DA5|nr:RICIN domain-containing protein [Mycobacterium sp.]MDI3315072.1 RICIN domain-containing protein [Mycobacterium sp.]